MSTPTVGRKARDAQSYALVPRSEEESLEGEGSPQSSHRQSPIVSWVSHVSMRIRNTSLRTTVLVLGVAQLLVASSVVVLAAKCKSDTLGDLALQKVLDDGSQIFGPANASAIADKAKAANWMSWVPDSTPLVHLNIPGTHETSTWNFSQAQRDSLRQNTDPANGVLDAVYYRCQQASILDSLNAGFRFFDLRYAFDPTWTRLVFWHSQALISAVTTVEDVLYGFYAWLDAHPRETLILSFQYEGSTQSGAGNDAAVQAALFSILTSSAARAYFLPLKDELPTLGAARGKIILFRRFDMDQSPPSYEVALPGLHMSPANWPDDGKDFALVYNTAKNLTAYVEDYYEPDDVVGNAADNIAAKFAVTTQHLAKAAAPDQAPDSLFITFASGTHSEDVPPVTPEIMALGNGTDTPNGGMNQQLLPFLKTMKGKRVGIVVLDFWDTPGDLAKTILEL